MWNRFIFTGLTIIALACSVVTAAYANERAPRPAKAPKAKTQQVQQTVPQQPPVPQVKNRKIDEDLVYHSNLGKAQKVLEILAAGANPNAKSGDNWSAISLAASRNDKENYFIVQYLIKYGADMNVRDPRGETPIMNAITNNNLPLVKLLIDSGADFRAVNTMGRSVLAFAEYYGNHSVIDLVNETIRLDEEKIREGKSRRRFYRMLDDFIFFNCVQQYVTYNQQTDLYKGEAQNQRAKQLGEQAENKILNSRVELEHNFGLPTAHASSIAQNTQIMMFRELEALISTRNRRSLGVGTDQDVDKRCTSILNTWRSNFEGYETEKAKAEMAKAKPEKKPAEQKKEDAVFVAPSNEVPVVKQTEAPIATQSVPVPAVLPDSLKAAPAAEEEKTLPQTPKQE